MAGMPPQAFGLISEWLPSLVQLKNTGAARAITFAQRKCHELTSKQIDTSAIDEIKRPEEFALVDGLLASLPRDWLDNVPIANTVWLANATCRQNMKPNWLVSHVSAETFFENKHGFRTDTQSATLYSIFGQKPNFTPKAAHVRNFSKVASRHRILLLEDLANREPDSTSAQAEYLRAIIDEDPEYVVRRVESGKYAMDEDIKLLYFKALVLAEKLSPDDIKATTARRMQASNINQPAGTEEKPLHVVMVPTKGSFFREQFWNTLRFLIGLFLIMSVIEAQLQMKMTTNQKEIAPDNSEKNVKFCDVQGVDEAKQELKEVVEFLKTPERFQKLGGNLPTGVLLIGPPGTGKTLLARAVAGEADVPFFFCSGSEFDEMFVGVGAARVRNLFAAAKEHSPCIIFIDELDAIGGTRIPNDHQPYSRMTLNQLLVELDGFDKTEGIVVIGATNFPEILDKALTRPGRFDSKVMVTMPDVRGRKEILELYLEKIPSGDDVDASVLARGTIGFSGADLSNVVNQAAIRAAVEGESHVTMKHLEFAKDKIIMGPERKSAVISERNRELVAYHESGHAIVAVHTADALPVHKATIMPRGSALGMVSQLPEKDELSWSKKQLLAKLDVCMGGRVAEELIFGKESVTTGASSDMEQATQVATAMVTQYGMSDKIGTVMLNDVSKLSPDMQSTVENEIRALIKDSYERVRTLLTNKSKEHRLLAEALLKYETLDAEELKTIIAGKKLSRTL